MRSLSFSLRFTIRILSDTEVSRRIWDVRQISARNKRYKGEFNTICSKYVLRAESPSRRILLEDDTLEYTSIDYMDHPIVAPRKRFRTSNRCIEGFTGSHRNCRYAIQKYRRDPRWWFHDRKFNVVIVAFSVKYIVRIFSVQEKRSCPMRNDSIIRRFIWWKMASSWSSVLETTTEYYHEFLKSIQC